MLNTLKDTICSLLNRQTINLVTNESLSGKVVMITGASRGIGKSTAEVLFSQGANLVLSSNNFSEMEKAFSNYRKEKLLLIRGDVRSQTDILKTIKSTLARFGKIDVLINNAGIFEGDYLEKVNLKDFEKIISINIMGVFSMTKAVVPVMKKQRSGLIINMGSRISHNTNIEAKRVLYATTKYAVEGFSKALNNELKPWGIRVTCLMPGTVSTFRSPHPQKYLSPYTIGKLVSSIIKLKDIDFESIVLKSKYE